MAEPKKLIEVALPIKEISAESVRDKSIRHGHISTLHLWWARRPLPVCRAIVFASLVPDPEDINCPKPFKDAVEILIGKKSDSPDLYKTYLDIPWTSVFDPMEDNLRNRLQMFIGKFTEQMQQHLLGKTTKPQAGDVLSNGSLIKWDNKNNEGTLNIARQLIWVAHNSRATSKNINESAQFYINDFNNHYKAIKSAEKQLYSLIDRHSSNEEVYRLNSDLNFAIEAFLDKMPKVFDPFAGGGAIPLEAARLGCRSFGNDINPVAHIIQKGSLEFPQKFGKPIVFSTLEFVKIYGKEEFNKIPNEDRVYKDGDVTAVKIANRLSFDVSFYSKKLLHDTEKEIGYLYPVDKIGTKPIAYYWARVATCSNPSCKAEVPILRQFYLANTPTKKIFLNPIINGTNISFELKKGECNISGWTNRANLKCPCCGNTTSVGQIKEQSIKESISQRLLAVIYDSKDGKEYRIPNQTELESINFIPEQFDVPKEKMQRNSAGGDTFSWGITEWGQMFTKRQAFTLQTFTKTLATIKDYLKTEESEYNSAIITYLAILIDRVAVNSTSFGLWKPSGEFLSSAFGRQAIPMVFDFPESNPFCDSTGSLLNQLDWIIRYIESESSYPFNTKLQNASSGEKEQFKAKYLTAVVTDPPYYDAIAYADLSDFFYVWLKRTLGDIYPLNFATPQTPKSEECTALKHHHNDNKDEAKKHFEGKLTQIFDAIEHQTQDIISIMFAHQSTEAWTTLCNSILGARMNISSSWPMDSERGVRAIALAGAALESSVTVACVPARSEIYGDYKVVKKAIELTVAREVEQLYCLGFRGADLLTACFGKAVSEFGKYKKVEKADGSEITVAELLGMARESAFNALLKGFDGDEFTKFYIGWLQLNGFSESDFDDVATFAKAGLSINVSELFKEHILIKNVNKQTLGGYAERNALSNSLGMKSDSFLIDHVHKAMALFKGSNRAALLNYINDKASSPDNSFWRVVTAIDELLPKDSEDQLLTRGLITNKESLIRESKSLQKEIAEQGKLEL